MRIYQEKDDFCIEAKNIIPLCNFLDSDQDQIESTKYNGKLEEAKEKLMQFFADCNLEIRFDLNHNVDHIYWGLHQQYNTDKYQPQEFLDNIASYIKKGSYIQFEDGSDYGEYFRWVFNGKELIEDYPILSWTDPNSL